MCKLKNESLARIKLYPLAIDKIFNIYLRFLALVCLGFTGVCWLILIGAYSTNEFSFFLAADLKGAWRFDLMPWQWRWLMVGLAVAYPIVALGLWGLAYWGIIFLILINTIEACLAFGYQKVFSLLIEGVMWQSGFLAILLVVWFMLSLQKRKQRLENKPKY
ncbi:DUF6163 family protein [Bartonella sp. DGB2]|uniref:DUF6163 family protein n=1 Tax=Bartonella sp. DGB2 TaxID=3388426 RepID=UPI003990263A